MRVCVITTWFPTALNTGAGSFIARDAVALSKDHDVAIVHLVGDDLDDGVREFAYAGIPVERLPIDVRTRAGKVAAMREVPRRLRGFDLVHTMAAPAITPFVLRRPKVPWVHTEHWSQLAVIAQGGRTAVDRWAIDRTFSGPDELVAVSEYLADLVRRVRRKPVDVVGNIVDRPAQATLVARTGPLRLLGASNVIPSKGWRIAVDALRILLERGVDAHLTWLGDGLEFEALRAASAELPISVPGRVDSDGVARAMAEADVFVLPTERETFSLVTVEALAAGVPVVTSGVGAHVDFLRGGHGVVVDRDAQAIADGIMAAETIDRSAVRAHGEELLTAFSEESFRANYLAVYERAVR
ncbi:glycosyltransferase [Microbacterium paludicola]|uniref:glycosyltransferase n=1 Tax=Microbacterium paludicola TaxID=300019 RepID=UPI0011A74185|nr:glycosyltransferase [Microbacterium paludicola]